MFDDFEHFHIQTQSDPPITIHGVKRPSPPPDLPPLLLLHGFPQNYRMWHQVAPRLTSQYNVIVIDLRGYGSSSKPAELPPYAKSAMASDCVAVMRSLGFSSFFVCAHDRGARVAHKLCVDFPDAVRKAILLDICPTVAMYEQTGFTFALRYWHWFFLTQDAPLPEAAILASPREFASKLLLGLGNACPPPSEVAGCFGQECYDSYLKGLGDPETVHGMCQDYRAAATLDLEEGREDIKKGRKVKCPLLVIWATQGLIEKLYDAVEEWRKVTEEGVQVEGYAVDAGHFIPDDVPDEVVSAITKFLV